MIESGPARPGGRHGWAWPLTHGRCAEASGEAGMEASLLPCWGDPYAFSHRQHLQFQLSVNQVCLEFNVVR